VRPLETRHAWRGDRPAEEVWAAIVDAGSYRTWWPWLKSIEPASWREAQVTRATVRAPAGYRLRLEIVPATVEPPRRLEAEISGDARGTGIITIDALDIGCRLAIDWSLRPAGGLLTALTTVARPIMVRGHDWIIADGVARFGVGAGIVLTPEGG
jgi:uncharacterized protein YndB with AHSA1/START domain